MCGIMGYVGSKSAAEVLLGGLRRLEYRGYDSAGIGTIVDGALQVHRSVGPVENLAAHLTTAPLAGTIGIAHTRWATHGPATVANAHPHVDGGQFLALVHNGIIENHASLRALLARQDVEFASDTDSEVLVQLVGFLYQLTGDLSEALRQALRQVEGTFAIALICAEEPKRLFAARRGSPLIVGRNGRESFLASDTNALVGLTKRVCYLEEDQIVELGPEDQALVAIRGHSTHELLTHELDLELERIERGDYPHYMLKEIREQPQRLQDALRGRLDTRNGEVILGGLDPYFRLNDCRHAVLFGCGSAWHASLVGRYVLEEIAKLPSCVEYASELRYRQLPAGATTLGIAVSQSGETADTLAALRKLADEARLTLGVVNVVGSSIARETDAGVFLHAGPEIGVASTKAFTAQVLVLTLLALFLARRRGVAVVDKDRLFEQLQALPDLVQRTLRLEGRIKHLAAQLLEWDNWLYLGRGVSFPVALEGALKLKEVSYIHAEGLPAAEVKHGPMALIDDGMPVVVIAPRDQAYIKTLGNIQEVRSRGARVIAVTNAKDSELDRLAHEVLRVPSTDPLLSPVLTTIPLQLLAYHAAVLRGHDVDKPRNLAKSVTVE